MKKFFYTIAAVVVAASLCSCNMEIKNPQTKNFVGTWDLAEETITALDGSTTTHSNTGEYVVITEDTFTTYNKSGRAVSDYDFKYENGTIFLDGVSYYKVLSISGKQMKLDQRAFLLLYSGRELTFNKR